jgi:hypothetical protein
MAQLATNKLFDFPIPVMSKAQEQAAEAGRCPGCGAYSLQPINRGAGMLFMGCDRCRNVTVLNDQ